MKHRSRPSSRRYATRPAIALVLAVCTPYLTCDLACRMSGLAAGKRPRRAKSK
jgi:hypothetical protein